jgi:hypothetical protein
MRFVLAMVILVIFSVAVDQTYAYLASRYEKK